MKKPDYLYHGSTKKLEILKPAQATGFSGAGDNECAVYAVSRDELAVAFALTLKARTNNALFSVDITRHPPKITLKETAVCWDTTGYIYKLSSATFQCIAPEQWVSYVAVRPLEVVEINPRHYKRWIEFI